MVERVGTRRPRIWMVGAAIAVTAGMSLVGCGSSSSTSTTPANTLSVVALDQPSMAFRVTGSPHAGLVSMTFDNQGDYTHEMTLLRFKPGATLEEVKAALKGAHPEQAAAALVEQPDSEITGPEVIGPHMKEMVAAPLTAGHYLIICFLPGLDGMTHAQMGMLGEVTVAASTTSSPAPATSGVVTLSDKGIALPASFKSGGTFAVTNTGTKPHDFALATLKGAGLGAFFQCVNASFGGAQKIGDCPGTLAGGVGELLPGQTAYITVTLAPGTYGYVSTQGEGADFMAGLQGTFVVN